MFNMTTTVFKGRELVLVSTIVTYAELCFVEYFSANKCKHFEGAVNSIWGVMLLSNTLKGLPSVPC